MVSRVTLLEIDTLRVDIATLKSRFEREIAPALREFDGYRGVIAMSTPEGKALLVSLWETPEALEAAAGFAGTALADFATLFKAPPGRELYDVAYLDLVEHEALV